jgi:ribosomal protein S18 acetylase RimI-like enzyme
MIREVRDGEQAAAGELRVAAYRALGLLSDGYANRLRGFGFDGGCTVLVAAGEDDRLLGTITLEWFGPHSELARDDTEADIRAFAVDAEAQGQGTGRALLAATVEHAARRGLHRLRLCTQPEMKTAQRLYAAAGFTRTPDLDWEPPGGPFLQAYELGLTPKASL